MTMKLVKPTHQHSKQIMAYRQAFLNSREQPYGSCSLQHFDSIDEWFKKVNSQKKRENLPPNRVPSTQFLSIEKGKIVGFINIRHRLTPDLLIESGHIGYSVHPDERRKGYATEQLRLSLLEAKKLGLEKMLITCDKENIGSAKTIQKVGGILENEVASPDTGKIVQRYWIEL
ncbi:GNAT family N-acetyltransferase [Bacillus pseudomycoides]|nr:GNAT family N-acetyltransferase [Bacillus pseudomycoides]